MANDKKFVVKNGLQANNVAFVNESNATNVIEASMLSTDTLSFSGNSGQLFSISDTMSGVIFGVNDVSGIPSIEVDDTGDVRIAEFSGNVSIGTSLDTHKLYVQGNAVVNGTMLISNLVATDINVSGNLTVSGTTTYINSTALNIGDSLITLNADLPSGTAPTENAGIEINRGSAANVQFLWDETNDRWSTNTQPLAAGSIRSSQSITIGTGGTYEAGSIYSDSSWGMIFRARQASPAAAQFRWANSADGELMRIHSDGNVLIGRTAPFTQAYRMVVNGNSETSAIPFAINDDRSGSADSRVMAILRGGVETGSITSTNLLMSIAGSSNLAFQTAGFEQMRITNDGRVGIGTIDPSAKLQVIGNARIGQASDNSTHARLDITAGGSGFDSVIDLGFWGTFDAAIWHIKRHGADNTFRIAFAGSGSEDPVFVLNSSGNLGLGTVSPSGRLHVTEANKGFNNYGNINVFTNNTAAADIGGSIAFGGLNTTGGTNPYVFGKIQGIKEGSASSWNGALLFGTTAGTSAVVERMRLTSTGDLAIGTVGNLNTTSKLRVQQTGSAEVLELYATTTTKMTLANDNNLVAIQETAGAGMDLMYNAAGTLTSGLRLNHSGNIGIGTTGPNSLLNLSRSTATATPAATPSIILTNRNTSINGTIAGGLFVDTYRDVSNPHYSGGIWFTRNQTAGNLSSSSDIVFGVMAEGSTGLPTPRMRLTAAGNFGIATDSPVGRLSVSLGSATSSGATAGLGSWDNTYVTFGDVGVNSNAVGIGYNSTTGGSLISLAPSVDWRRMNYLAQEHRFYSTGAAEAFIINSSRQLRSTAPMVAWNTTTPGSGVGSLHLGSASTTSNAGSAITFGARDGGNEGTAQAGIYINSDGTYGTRMYLATSNDYSAGSRTGLSIDHVGIVSAPRDSMRAKIFYDVEDGAYYMDPGSATISLNVAGEIRGVGELSISNYAVGNMQLGAMNIGRTDTNYEWGGTWAGDIRLGILANCSETWELGIHDASDAVMSGLHYNGAGVFTIGRDIGWGTSYLVNPQSMRSPIFYDTNDTYYFLDPASTTTSLLVAGTIEQGNNYAHPNIEWSASGNSTGEVIFYLPGVAPTNYGMVHMVFDIYEYITGKMATVIVGGHNWTTAWYNNTCQVVGWTDKTVRLGVKNDGTNDRYCVVFGGIASTWTYATIRLRKIHNASFYNNIMDLGGNWSAFQTTTETFVNITGDLRELRTPSNMIVEGNLGIGTTSPDARLDVLGASGDQIRLRTAESEEFRIGRNSSTGYLNFYGSQSGYTGYTFGGVDGTHMTINANGATEINSTSDYQLFLSGRGTSWAGIAFSDNLNTDVMYYNGSTSTFAIGGSGSAVANKKLHINGGVTIGPGLASSSSGTNSLSVESHIYGLTYYNRNDNNARWDGSNLILRGASPTVYFRDTDHTTAMIHVNSNVFYVLRGTGDTETWSQVNSVWPLEINLTNNNAVFGGILDSVSEVRGTLFRDRINTDYYLDPGANESAHLRGTLRFGDHGAGVVGLYDSYRYQLVFAMGDSYKGALNGTSVTSGYGLWWSHPNAGGVASNLTNHGLMCIVNGNFFASLDASTQAITDMRAPLFYDRNDTTYYIDPNGTSYLNLQYTNRYFQRASGVPTNNLGDPTVTEMALFQEQFNNKTEFYPIANLKFYTSTDGSTWTEYTSFSDTEKRRFLGGNGTSGIIIPNGTPYFRIEVINSGPYVFLNALYMYWSGNSHSTTVKIRALKNGVWEQWTNSSVQVSSWPGHLYLPFNSIPFLTGSTGHYNTVHIDFQPTWSTGEYAANNINLFNMQIWGGYPAGKRTIYSVDEVQNTTFPAEVSATLFRDTNNSAYFVDPSSTSVLSVMRADTIQRNGGNQAILLNNGTYTQFCDPAGTVKFWIGGSDAGNYFNNSTHYFRNTGSANQFLIYGDGSRRAEYHAGTGALQIYGDAGGWATGTFFLGSSGTNRGGFGALGSADTLSNFWIGTSNGSPAVNIFTDGRVEAIASHRAPIFYNIPNTAYYIDGEGTSVLNIINATDVYLTGGGWFRSYGEVGLYSQSYGQHFYPDSGGFYWEVDGPLRIRDGYEGTIKGYVGYHDANGFGFLGGGGSWWLNTPDNAAMLVLGGSNGLNAFNSGTGRRLMIGGGDSDAQTNYYIGTNLENIGGDYNKLDLRWHTGIRMGAQSMYGGIRLYDSEDLGTVQWQFNGGSGYGYKYVWLYTNTTGIYSDTNGAHFHPNGTTSYGQWYLQGSKGSYGGITDGYSGVSWMHDSGGNGGMYREASGIWYYYYHVANSCLGVGGSSTSASYDLYVSGAIYATSDIVAYSDVRKKENIITIESALDKVNQLRGVYYNKIGETARKTGVIAQEVNEVLPEVVTYADDVDEYGVNYGNFAGVFIEAIKELTDQVNALKKEIEELKNGSAN